MKFWLCGFSMRKKWKSNVIIQFSHKVIYNSCIQSIREKDQWKKNKRMASIYIKNYMKGKRLLVAKNAKVNKKILWSGYTGTNSSLWIPKKTQLCLFYFCLFSKGEWYSNWEGMEKNGRGWLNQDFCKVILRKYILRKFPYLEFTFSGPINYSWKLLKDQRSLQKHGGQANIILISKTWWKVWSEI